MPSASSVTEEWEFSPEPSRTRDVRHLVAQALEEVELGDLIAAASLVVSELVTNAVLHARTVFVVRLRIADEVLRIEVEDRGPGRPVVRNFTNHSTSGRGLRLVDSLSRAWGVTSVGRGKLVWAEIVAEAPRADQAFDFDAVEEL